jgi:hypothetical protein
MNSGSGSCRGFGTAAQAGMALRRGVLEIARQDLLEQCRAGHQKAQPKAAFVAPQAKQ